MNTILAWFIRNGVAANLLMGLIVFGGLISLGAIRQQVAPDLSTGLISVSVAYLGAAPEGVEVAVCARIEERVRDLEMVKRIRSVASEGVGTVTIELLDGSDVNLALDEVKARVDAIDTFPEEAEKPLIQEVRWQLHVLSVAISGPADERTLKRLGERVRAEILKLPGISQAELVASRPYEISIEVSEKELQRHRLTFDRVAEAVRRSSLDLPGGSVKTDGGEILLRTQGQAYEEREFEDLVLMTHPDGTRLRLGEVATVVDGFAETGQAARFDGDPAVLVQVYRVGQQRDTDISDRVRTYVEQAQRSMPDGIRLTVLQDDALVLRSRLGTLLRNGFAGFALVLVVLALFLKFRLAAWVALGIPVSFLGTIAVMQMWDYSINLMSLMAFLIVLGIVVDDSIIIGENIYRHFEMGKVGLKAALDGVGEVAMPVTFSVLTSIAVFAPLFRIPGTLGQFMGIIAFIVISTLIFSLVESLLVLPYHLSNLVRRTDPNTLAEKTLRGESPGSGRGHIWDRFQAGFSHLIDKVVYNVYRPALDCALTWRYTTAAAAVAILFLSLGYVAGGHIKFTFAEPVEPDTIVAFLTMPQGTQQEVTAAALERLETSALELAGRVSEEGEPGAIQHILCSIGDQPYRRRQSFVGGKSSTYLSGSHLGEVHVELSSADNRQITGSELVRRWRELAGPIPGAMELEFSASLFTTGEAINIQLAGEDLDSLSQAAAELKERLAQYPGVFEIADSIPPGKQELGLSITAEAEALGLTLSDFAHQVRQAFYGEEVQRIQRGRDELRVMLRYPEPERRSLASLEEMRIRTPQGHDIPFASVGHVKLQRGFASITRTDGKRTVNVTAGVDVGITTSGEILADVQRTVFPKLLAKHPGLSCSFEGEQRQQDESTRGLQRSFLLALFLIYGLLAIPFRSYLQPLIVMSAIPFGIIGAIWGHVLMGRNLTSFSTFGILALTGVVVNDSLVLVDFFNRARRNGVPLFEAIRDAGIQRFRPIILTSLTTFVGLVPLLSEKSMQAQTLIPIAISLGFGVLFATVIILFLVPIGLLILMELQAGARRWFVG